MLYIHSPGGSCPNPRMFTRLRALQNFLNQNTPRSELHQSKTLGNGLPWMTRPHVPPGPPTSNGFHVPPEPLALEYLNSPRLSTTARSPIVTSPAPSIRTSRELSRTGYSSKAALIGISPKDQCRAFLCRPKQAYCSSPQASIAGRHRPGHAIIPASVRFV